MRSNSMGAPPQRRNSRAKNPARPERAASSSAWVWLPAHHCDAGTVARTAETCCPQPAHVVFWQTLQVVARHISQILSSRSPYTPRGIVHILGGVCWSAKGGARPEEETSPQERARPQRVAPGVTAS